MDTPATVPAYQPDPRLEQARDAIANQLGILPSEVTVKIGRNPDSNKDNRIIYDDSRNASPGDTEELIITIHRPGLDLERPRFIEEIRSSLAGLDPLANVVQMTPTEKVAEKLLGDLKTATEGTNFDQKLLDEWPGFNPESLRNGRVVPNYSLQNVELSPYGVTATLNFPQEKGVDHTADMERFAEVTKGRVEQIREIQLTRVLKYTRQNLTERGLNAQEVDLAEAQAKTTGMQPEDAKAQALENKIQLAETKVREDFAKLQISVNLNKNEYNGGLMITMRSPEQQAAYDAAPAEARDLRWTTPPTNADELSSTNPLTNPLVSLTTSVVPATESTPEKQPQLNKVIARSVLFDKDKNIAPDAIKLFGRNDIKSAIIKELKNKVLPAHPDKTAALQEVLDSDLFKNHEAWHPQPGTAGAAKPEPVFGKPANTNDVVEMSITLHHDKDPEKNQLLQLINGLAGITPAATPTAAIPETAQTDATKTAIEKILAGGASTTNIADILKAGASTPMDQATRPAQEGGLTAA